jgi:hypothetical protein
MFLTGVFFVNSVHIAAILNIFLASKLCISFLNFNFCFFIKMYSVSVKCLIFTLIMNLYLFFGQSTSRQRTNDSQRKHFHAN